MSLFMRLPPTVRRYGLQAVALVLFGFVVWRQLPLDSLEDDGITLLQALFGLVCVLGPDDVVSYGSLRGHGYTSYTAREAQTFENDVLITICGFVILIDALIGFGKWLIWTWL